MTIPRLTTEQGTLFDYDLNIYHLEEQNAEGTYEYTDQWYVDIYDYTNNEYGGGQLEHVTGPFKLTPLQRDALQLEDGNWDDDSWYGMWGFMQDYKTKLTSELLGILNALPKYKEEVLF